MVRFGLSTKNIIVHITLRSRCLDIRADGSDVSGIDLMSNFVYYVGDFPL